MIADIPEIESETLKEARHLRDLYYKYHNREPQSLRNAISAIYGDKCKMADLYEQHINELKGQP